MRRILYLHGKNTVFLGQCWGKSGDINQNSPFVQKLFRYQAISVQLHTSPFYNTIVPVVNITPIHGKKVRPKNNTCFCFALG